MCVARTDTLIAIIPERKTKKPGGSKHK